MDDIWVSYNDFMNNSLQVKLSTFGLSPIESQIYLHLLGKQPQTVISLSKSLNIPRTSLYDNLSRLIEKGLVERIVKYKSQEFKAHPIDILESIIERKRTEIALLQKQFDQLKHQLTTPAVPATATQIRYYHGVSGIQQMMFNNLRAERSMFGYSTFGRQEIVGVKFMRQWNAGLIEKKIQDRVLVNPTELVLRYVKTDVDNADVNIQRQQYQSIRYLSEEQFYISGDISIYNDIMAVQYWEQGEIVGVEIENPEFIKTQKSIFEMLWQQAKPIQQLN
jgi:sugar-specific transcriptional regulator TrmB